MAQRRECFQIPGVAHSGGGVRGYLPFGARVGDYLFSGGCMGQDPANGKVVDGAAAQAEFAFRNVRTLLDTSGFSTGDVVRMWVWIKDQSVRPAVDKPWKEMFPDEGSRPAVSFVQAELPSGMLVQLEIIAVRGGRPRRSFYLGDTKGSLYPSGAAKGDIVCVGALNGKDPRSGALSPDGVEQAAAATDKLKQVMDLADLGLESMGHLLAWYRDHSMREVSNGPYTRLWPIMGDRPARHSVVRPMPAGEIFEIEGMGTIGARRKCLFIPGVFHGGIQGIENSLPFGTHTGKLVYSAATYGRNTQTGVVGAPEEQAELVMTHTKTLMDRAGITMDDVAHMFLWCSDRKNRDLFNGPWEQWFPSLEDRPARHAIESALPGNFVVQVEIIAVAP